MLPYRSVDREARRERSDRATRVRARRGAVARRRSRAPAAIEQVPAIDMNVVREPDQEASARDAAAELLSDAVRADYDAARSEEHTSELPSLMRTSYAAYCLTKKKN